MTEYHVKLDEVYKFKENIEEISRRYYSSNITSEDKMLLVAEIDGEIVGFTLGKIDKTPPFYQIEEFGHLLGTFVREEYRRKRIGEKMTYELLEWFKSKGLKRVESSVDIGNKIGVSAWTKFG